MADFTIVSMDKQKRVFVEHAVGPVFGGAEHVVDHFIGKMEDHGMKQPRDFKVLAVFNGHLKNLY